MKNNNSFNFLLKKSLFLLLATLALAPLCLKAQTEEKDDRDMRYPFVCQTGQTIYYRITNYNQHQVALALPNAGVTYWTKPKPTGNIVFPSSITHDGITYTVTSIDDMAFTQCNGLTGTLVIPNTVVSIGYNAFKECVGFTGLVLPDGLTRIQSSTFWGCSGFTGDLVIPNSVTVIENNVFYNCTGFDGTLVLSNSLLTIGPNAFNGCTNLSGELVLPNTLATISNNAFYNCHNLSGDLIIPDQITSIRQSSFDGCNGLNGILVIPSSVTTIQDFAFRGCNGITAIYSFREEAPTIVPETNNVIPQVFGGINRSIPIYIPSGSTINYQNAIGWDYFNTNHFIENRIFAKTNNNTMWSNQNNWTAQTLPTANENVIITTDCNMDVANCTIANLTILKRYTATLQPQCSLTVTNTLNNHGNATNLVIGDGSQLWHCNNGLLATVKKNIEPYTSNSNDKWQLISSPMKSNINITSVSNLTSNNYDLYYYDESINYWMNQKVADNYFNELEAKMGYLYSNSQEVTLTFAGEVESGNATITTPLSHSANGSGFNLIGNPYIHNITSYSTNNAVQGCFRMNQVGNELMVGDISELNPLKPGEGFFVKALGDDASITFNARSLSENSPRTSIRMEISENNLVIDRLLVKDAECQPLEKLSINNKRTKIFASRNHQEYAIIPIESDEQAINFKTEKNGTYTLTVYTDDFDTDYLHLIDNITGADIDLLSTPTYTFEAKKTDYAWRFRLLLSPAPETNSDIENDSFVFLRDRELCIENTSIADLQIIDAMGRIMTSKQIEGNYTHYINTPGVYVIRLYTDYDMKTQKIVVK